MQTIDRVVQVLELLSNNKDGLGIKEISKRVDIPLSTTHRILSSLKKHGYISQNNETKKYKLGIEILALAVQLLDNMDIVKVAKPILEELSSKYGQLVFLSVLEHNKVICVDMVNNSNKMKFYVQIGSHMPVHCAASGKAIVAYQDEDIINTILNNEKRTIYTNFTRVDIDEIKKELSKVKESGFSICDQEMELGVKALAVPVRERDGSIRASITIIFIKQFEHDENSIIQDLLSASAKISRHLGFLE